MSERSDGLLVLKKFGAVTLFDESVNIIDKHEYL